MTLLSLCLLWWWGWGWCDDDEDRRDRGGARETIWDYRDSWLSTTRGLTTHNTVHTTWQQYRADQHTTPTLSLSCHLKLLSQGKAICTIEGLAWSYSFSYSFIRNLYFYDVIWCEVAQLQNHMMKKRLTVINFVLSHLFLFTLESIFHTHYITLYEYFCNKKKLILSLAFYIIYFCNKKFTLSLLCLYMFRLKLNW